MNLLTSSRENGNLVNMKCCFRKAIPLALCALCIMACLFGCTSNENPENAYDSLEEITFASNDDIVGNREYVGDLSIVIPDGFKDPKRISKFNTTISVFDGVNVEQFEEFTDEQETILLDIYALEDTEKAEVDKVIEYLQNCTEPEPNRLNLIGATTSDLESEYVTSINRTQINGIPAIVVGTTIELTDYPMFITVIPIENGKAAYYISLCPTLKALSNRDYCESILSTIEIGDQYLYNSKLPYMANKNKFEVVQETSSLHAAWTPQDFVSHSDMVVIGTVESVEGPTLIQPRNGDLDNAKYFTDYIIVIDEVLYDISETNADAAVKENVKIRTSGGVGTKVLAVEEDDPRLEIGRQYLFFLYREGEDALYNTNEDYYKIHGSIDGSWDVKADDFVSRINEDSVDKNTLLNLIQQYAGSKIDEGAENHKAFLEDLRIREEAGELPAGTYQRYIDSEIAIAQSEAEVIPVSMHDEYERIIIEQNTCSDDQAIVGFSAS